MAILIAAATVALPAPAAGPSTAEVELLRLPRDLIKPRAALGSDGTLHLVVYSGALQQGDLYYLRRTPEGATSPRRRINVEPASVNGRGSIASAHMALGVDDRVHVAYPGSRTAQPQGPYRTPGIFYSRLSDDGVGFEAPRNLMRRTRGGQFGGQSIAADREGRVWVSWYGVDAPRGTEPDARLFVARSTDGGATFTPERPAREETLGACYCCAMSSMADDDGRLLLLYRAAGEGRHRDVHLFSSLDGGSTFEDLTLDEWEFVGCPETGGSLARGAEGPLAIWEAAGKLLKVARLVGGGNEPPLTVLEGDGRLPRYPVAATNDAGQTLVAWVEGISAKRPGDLVWQLLDGGGRPVGARERRAGQAKPNSLVAVVARPDGSFLVVI